MLILGGGLCARQCIRLGVGKSLQLQAVPAKWLTSTACLRGVEPLNPQEDWWQKNKRLNRPMSPHLTIYQPQMTTLMSVTHRGTGLALSALMSGFAIGMLALPHSFPHYYQALACSTGGMAAAIFATKFILAFPLTYHFANGIRHLAWDLGKGFQMPDLYKSGYAVLAVSVIAALGLASL